MTECGEREVLKLPSRGARTKNLLLRVKHEVCEPWRQLQNLPPRAGDDCRRECSLVAQEGSPTGPVQCIGALLLTSAWARPFHEPGTDFPVI